MSEMSRYIDIEKYHAVETSHPHYLEMIQKIIEFIRDTKGDQLDYRVLELGAGTGLATRRLCETISLKLDAVEIDEKCFEKLRAHVEGMANCYCEDAATFSNLVPYDAIVSVFAHDHIPPSLAPKFAENIKRNLKKGGVYIMGGEILPFFADEAGRKKALLDYHGYIIGQALADGNYEVAKLEIDALKSGINKQGDFKRHESMFERELTDVGLELFEKIKIGPTHIQNVGGVFVYVFSRKLQGTDAEK